MCVSTCKTKSSSRKRILISKTHKCFWPVESKVYPCRFYPYLRVNANTLALFPVSSPPPAPPQCTAPSIPCGNVRRETVSALLQNLQRYLPSQHAAELGDGATDPHACTERAHAHGWYPSAEIIDANGAVADGEGGESRSRGQISPTWRKPWKKICCKEDLVCPEPKSEQLHGPVHFVFFFFLILCLLENS